MSDEQLVDTSDTEGESVELEGTAAGAAVEEEAQSLEERLGEVEAQAAEYLDGWQRARAELANYKKRVERERAQWEATIRGDVTLSLLPILDDLDRAVENLPADVAKHEWANGMVLIQQKLHGQLEALGLSEIEALGQPFNPELHEAVTQEESDDHESEQVIEVVRKGYMLEDRVIRPALVRVAR